MISTAFIFDAFIRDETAFARVVPAGDLFTLLSRQIVVPPSCVALVWGEAAQPWFVTGGCQIEAAGAREVLFVKAMPIPLEYEVSPLPSRDGFDFSATLRIAVQVVPDRTELEQFRKSLLGSRNRSDANDVRAYLDETIRRALSAFAKQHEAATLASREHWKAFEVVLTEQFQPVGFATGLALESDIRVTFASTDYADRQRDLSAVSRRNERISEESKLRATATEARRQHLDELATILDRVQAATKSSPSASVVDLIRTFDVTRRGELYRGLMGLGASRKGTEAILVVAGQELLWFSPIGGDKPIRRQSLTSSLGPLRSIRLGQISGRRAMLVGVRNGVLVADDEPLSDPTPYSFISPGTLRGGVNAAAILGDSIYATHSEAGFIRWKVNAPKAPDFPLSELTQGAKAVRDVQTSDDGRLWFTIDSRIIAWRPDSPEPPTTLHAPATVHSLLVTDQDIFAGLDNGAILHWDRRDLETTYVIQSPSGDAVHSLTWLAGGGVPRLLCADKRSHLTLHVLGESYHADYRWRQPLRWGAGASDIIVAVNDLRDQLILWQSDVPEEPIATIPVARICGHTVQDVTLVGAEPTVVTG